MSTSDRLTCSDGSQAKFKRQPISAVIGAASSQVSVMVASMLQLFKVMYLINILINLSKNLDTNVKLFLNRCRIKRKTQVKNNNLFKKKYFRFAYFSRVVPPDNLQAKAMALLVRIN